MLRTIRLLLSLWLLAGSLFAETEDRGRFFIERIDVRNLKRVSAALVTSETLLREGREYSESELGRAAARLARAPFLVASEFTLEKGSERGRYVLVITVTEPRPFFVLADARPIIRDEHGPLRYDYADDDMAAEWTDAAAGVRSFVGNRGIAHAAFVKRDDRHSFTADYAAFAAGYTQYDLFGTGSFATINLRIPEADSSWETLSPQVVVGVPVTANQTLTLNFEDAHLARDFQTFEGRRYPRQISERLVSLSWTYNTTNHPFVPTEGTLVRVMPMTAMRDRGEIVSEYVGRPATRVDSHANARGVHVLAVRYAQLSERDAVSAGVLAGWMTIDDRATARADVDWARTYEVFRAGYSRRVAGGAEGSDSRIELEGRFSARQRDIRRGRDLFGVTPDSELATQISLAWTHRASWGMLRLGAGYAW